MQANYNVHLSYGLKFDPEESAAMRALIVAAQGQALTSRRSAAEQPS